MAKRIDLAVKVAQETLKKSYNTLPLIPRKPVGNPFDYMREKKSQQTAPAPPPAPKP